MKNNSSAQYPGVLEKSGRCQEVIPKENGNISSGPLIVPNVQRKMVLELGTSLKEEVLNERRRNVAMRLRDVFQKDTTRAILRLIDDKCRERTAGKVDNKTVMDFVKSIRNCGTFSKS